MWPGSSSQNEDDSLSVDFDPDWYAKYEEEQKKRHRDLVIANAGYGYLFGQVIGTSAYVLQTRHAGPQALSAGAFMGVCLSVGFLFRSL
mmetsp:Transcript_14792/g.28634  ORF Transcript_14792/g.28634 Transcript_14792/m.28634 type:complete len:89 (-) Transcript_14792:269-535(-)|eukprot:CAMPEP_0171513818 /NCGR_PEP_ID=MMETSP0959-20130129/2468_1 /TAXON_ID=87120 /ORGANISM="Aurantiochytrium limacinum, Strain ATCCMYA-1381" /LENGTH=88 /DNA_ID=CAMNT_0012052011 /DNA_START=802 /DNA_END=1068 /DNA_ORIENTATION=-